MFTGIVEDVGKVSAAGAGWIEVSCALDGLRPGDSVAVDGVCLTVTSCAGRRFRADLSEETLRRTTLGAREEGARVNLERPVPAGGRLGGHVVQGHVDGVGRVRRVDEQAGSVEMWVEASRALSRYLVEKGSVAVDGVSLTVAALEEGSFAVALVPFTLERTTFAERRPGDAVNIEVDVLAKYVERLLGAWTEGGGR